MTEQTPIRACFHCAHSQVTDNADLRCYSLAVNGPRVAQTTGSSLQYARSFSGACGPEAHQFKLLEKADNETDSDRHTPRSACA